MQLPPPIHGVSVMNKIIKDSRLINEELHCDYINLATAKNINDLQKTGFHKYITTLKILAKAFFKMAGNRYRYVYITVFPWGFAFVKDSLVVLMARLFGLKPLLHLHTYGFKRVSESSGLKRRYYRFVFKNTRVICLSDLLIEDIENLYRGPVFILPNGIPQVNFENTYNNAQEPVTLLYLSNLIRGKGILVLLDAVELIKQKGYKFKLRVAGPEGNVDYATLKNRILEKGLVEDVKLLGPKFGEEKFSEFRNAGIFIMASDYDTFGLVYLEAMQFGVPCIGANIGGVPDVLGGGRGVIIPEITAEALASAIIDLLKDPGKRFSISETGFNYFKGNFTVDVFEQRLKNILMDKPDLVNGRLTR